MKRRSFVKKSISASILTPLAFSGLINAAGAVEGETETGTTWFTTMPMTTTIRQCVERSTDVGADYKQLVDVISGGVTTQVMSCFKVFDCFDASGNNVGSFRTGYVACGQLNQTQCNGAQLISPGNAFHDLEECSAPLGH